MLRIFQVSLMKLIHAYIKGLKVKENINDVNYVPILKSKRKTGFIGFIICSNSMLKLYYNLIESSKIDYLKMHKLSQDHLELFFGCIRAQGGYNNNPTSKQFMSAYHKLVIKVNDIESFNTRNCIPLELIDVLL